MWYVCVCVCIYIYINKTMETDAQGNVIRKGIQEDYTQYEINDILGLLT